MESGVWGHHTCPSVCPTRQKVTVRGRTWEWAGLAPPSVQSLEQGWPMVDTQEILVE